LERADEEIIYLFSNTTTTPLVFGENGVGTGVLG
jgi:hypothetical protein